MADVPARRPLVPPAWNPNESRYWDSRDLEAELRRTFQVCHECRMCVTYCGSFPVLFAAVDREIDAGRAEGAETLGPETIEAVADHCWQCKLCFLKCPYTEDEGAAELLDFPRLMAREKAQRARLGQYEVVGGFYRPGVRLERSTRPGPRPRLDKRDGTMSHDPLAGGQVDRKIRIGERKHRTGCEQTQGEERELELPERAERFTPVRAP